MGLFPKDFDPSAYAREKLQAALQDSDWRYDRKERFVYYVGEPYRDNFAYDIPLDTMDTSAAVLDTIAQIAGKTWGTPKVVGDLVLLLDAILHFQGTYCSQGVELGPVDIVKILS